MCVYTFKFLIYILKAYGTYRHGDVLRRIQRTRIILPRLIGPAPVHTQLRGPNVRLAVVQRPVGRDNRPSAPHIIGMLYTLCMLHARCALAVVIGQLKNWRGGAFARPSQYSVGTGVPLQV